MKIQTYRLRLIEDPAVARFRRLEFVLEDVPLAHVFSQGVHPHSHTTGLGHDCWGTTDAIVERLNADEAFVPGLKAHLLGFNITKPTTPAYWRRQATVMLDDLLKRLRTGVHFVDDICYEELRDLAVVRLRETWSHSVACELARGVGANFAGTRAFLKSIEPDIKVTGYGSLGEYDLGRVLSVDDFLTEDRLLLQHGLELQNFRDSGALAGLTTGGGHLRLVPKIEDCNVEWRTHPDNKDATVTYKCLVEGDQVRWLPDLGDSDTQRDHARSLAGRLGKGNGRYCFESRLGAMEQALNDPCFCLRFPRLRYGPVVTEWTPAAKLRHSAVACYMVPKPIDADRTNEHLQETLREFGRKTSGRKEQLVGRIAELLAEEYARVEPELDEFFGRRCFVRLKSGHLSWQYFPVLSGHGLSSSLLSMYCLRHMRGNTILEASHLNTSVTLTDLGEALLHRRVKLDGAFVEVL
ncbi:MAG: SAP domain-containing protein [Lentisphaerae bacterium]|jgi:hypothetical protein|nr:SAP domain-containing protein [Lentisphaerota bacterium]MBT5611650.1 SAP domain-containing protein [Lentisphaerota bacterium]